jgi:peptide/nickel transport system substrate-binding protein
MFKGMLNKLGKNRISISKKGGNVMRKLLVVLLALTLVVACAPAPAPTPTPKPVVEATPTPKTVVEATPMALPAVPKERTLTVAISSDMASLDWTLRGHFPLSKEVRKNVFCKVSDYARKKLPDGTVVADPWHYEPLLAESIDVSPDGLVWTFHLRKGPKYYPSGNEITAEDWMWYAQRYPGLGKVLAEQILVGLGTSDDPLKGFKVIDKYTVQLTADYWTPILGWIAGTYGYTVDSAEYKANATADDPWATEWAKTNMVGCGPYYIEDRVPGEYTTLRANPYYPVGYPYFERVIFRIIPSSADQMLMLKTGDVDIAKDLTPKQINEVKKAKGVKVLSFPHADMLALMMNNSLKPMDDVRVRRAVSYMVPYKDIIDRVYYGLGTPFRSPVPHTIPGSDYSYWEYDVPEEEAIKTAKALLAEAGYPDGLEFPLAFDLSKAEFETVATLIQGQMAKAGIKVSIEPMPRAAFTEKKNHSELVAFLDEKSPITQEAGYFLTICFGCEAFYSKYIKYCNPKVDELVAKGIKERDEAERFKLYSEAQRLVMEDAPWALIACRNANRVMRDDIEGYIHFPDNRYRYQDLWRK